LFNWSAARYRRTVGRVLSRKALAFGVYLVLLGVTYAGFKVVPHGFVPGQDKQYLVGFAQLPDGASLDRTEEVIRRMSDIALKTPGVKDAVAFPGLSIAGFTNAPNAGVVFFGLDEFDKRRSPQLSGGAIAGAINRALGSIQDAFIAVFPPPPVNGLGTIGGFKLQIEDRAGLGDQALYDAMKAMQMRTFQTPELTPSFSSFQINVPQLYADVDRAKAKQMGVALTDLFDTMQINLGSLYVNDFNRFGRTYRVVVQADAPFRSRADDIAQLKTRNAKGELVPLGSLMRVEQSFGPDRAIRYNAFPSADLNGAAAPGFSSGQAQAAIERIAHETLPRGITFEWTDLTYQEILAGNTALLVFPLCVLLVFLVLAAQYESLKLPLAIILIVPMCLLFAIAGVHFTGGDNNIFTQIALFVLMGLACKNAILIVEFAREMEMKEPAHDAVRAALEACRMRLRPILMTSFAFIMGVVPLVFSTGAGSEMRHAIGIAVFWGMLGVTFFGLFLTPVFYVLLHRRFGRTRSRPAQASA
jgi:multidrug efflux pump